MNDQLQREIRRLRRTNAIALGLLVIVAMSAFVQARPGAKAKFDEIDVGRINVREPDGRLRLTISNHARLPDVVVGGKSYPLRGGTGVVLDVKSRLPRDAQPAGVELWRL